MESRRGYIVDELKTQPLSSLPGTVEIELIAWGARSYEQSIMTQTTDYSVGALGSKVVKTLALKPLLSTESLTLSDAVVRLSTTAEGNSGGKMSSYPCNTFYFFPIQYWIEKQLFNSLGLLSILEDTDACLLLVDANTTGCPSLDTQIKL